MSLFGIKIGNSGGSGSGGGVTNSAGANVIPKSDGTNLVASQITDNGTSVTISPIAGGSLKFQQAATPTADIFKALRSDASGALVVTSDGLLRLGNGGDATTTGYVEVARSGAGGFQVICRSIDSDPCVIMGPTTAEGARFGSGYEVGWSSSAPTAAANDVALARAAAGVVKITGGFGGGGGSLQFTEVTAPAAPAANNVVLFAQDNGAGKTQLMALFSSGAAQQIAIQP